MSIRITQLHKKPELRYHFTLVSIDLFSFSALPRTVNPCITPRFTTNLPLGTSDRSCKWQPRRQRARNICPRWYIQHSSSFILLGIANSDINIKIKVSFQCMVHCSTQYTHVMYKNENLIGTSHFHQCPTTPLSLVLQIQIPQAIGTSQPSYRLYLNKTTNKQNLNSGQHPPVIQGF